MSIYQKTKTFLLWVSDTDNHITLQAHTSHMGQYKLSTYSTFSPQVYGGPSELQQTEPPYTNKDHSLLAFWLQAKEDKLHPRAN